MLSQSITTSLSSLRYLVHALEGQPDVRTTAITNATLYHCLLTTREIQSSDFHLYKRRLTTDYLDYRPHFFSLTDYSGIFELLFDTDQIVGRYTHYGHTETSRRRLPRDRR